MADDAGQKISDPWILVSHCHLDLAAVRRVRDELERQHGNPLLFFLLCLKEHDEVDDLIKREISARNFFLLCDSDAARKSEWVQKERAFVESLKDRKVYKLDLSWPWERQERVINDALSGATTYINYSHKDRNRVRPYIDSLVKNDFAVFDFAQMPAGVSWRDEINRAIRGAVDGYFISVLSSAWLQSLETLEEFRRYVGSTTKPPIILTLDPLPTLRNKLPPDLQKFNILDFSEGNVADCEQQLLSALELRKSDGDRRPASG
jgi:hypothetical protein